MSLFSNIKPSPTQVGIEFFELIGKLKSSGYTNKIQLLRLENSIGIHEDGLDCAALYGHLADILVIGAH